MEASELKRGRKTRHFFIRGAQPVKIYKALKLKKQFKNIQQKLKNVIEYIQ